MRLVTRKEYLKGNRAYFITGVITAVDATIKHVIEQKDGNSIKATAPRDLVTGVALPIDVGVGVGVDQGSGNNSTTTSQAVGDNIWGVEYMEIKREWWNVNAFQLGRQVEKVKGGKFFGKETEEESGDEEDDTWKLTGGTSSLVNEDQLAAFVIEIK